MSNRFDPLLFGTDIPDPTVPYGVGDDGEYDADPMALYHLRHDQIERDKFRAREEFSEKRYREFGHEFDDVVRPSARRTVTIIQVGAIIAFAVTLIIASLRSAGVLW